VLKNCKKVAKIKFNISKKKKLIFNYLKNISAKREREREFIKSRIEKPHSIVFHIRVI